MYMTACGEWPVSTSALSPASARGHIKTATSRQDSLMGNRREGQQREWNSSIFMTQAGNEGRATRR